MEIDNYHCFSWDSGIMGNKYAKENASNVLSYSFFINEFKIRILAILCMLSFSVRY